MKAWLAALVLALAVSSPSQAGLVSLPTTWTNAQVLTHSALNNEFTAITDQVNGSLNEANLAATITFADGDFLDLSAINASSATEGIKFPQAASITSATGEGVCAWDSDDDEFRCGNGSTVGDWNMIDAAIMDPSPQLVFRDTTDDTSYMWHVDQADATVSGFALWKGTKTSATGSFTIESGQWWPLIEFTPNRDIRLWGDRSLIVDELTNRGLLLGGGINGAVTATAALTNGQLPIGSTGAAPVPATLTGTASEVDVTNGAGTITIGIVDPLAIAKGGTSLASLGDDAIVVGDSATAATARTITNCTDTGGNHLNYTQSTNSFSCGTSSSTTVSYAGGSFSRDTSTATGTQTVTGLGITPVECTFLAEQANSREASWGNGDIGDGGTKESVMVDDPVAADNYSSQTGFSVYDEETDGTDIYRGFVQNGGYTSGQLVFSWTRVGTPTGTVIVNYLCHN